MFKPLNNRILVKPHELPNETNSGIMLGDSKEKPVTGTVVVSSGIVKEGDNILFSKFGFDEFEIDGVVHYVVSETNILGIL